MNKCIICIYACMHACMHACMYACMYVRTYVRNELPDSVVNAPNVNTFKNKLDRHWRGEDFLYNYEAPVPGHQLAEDRAKRFEHVDLTIEATACGHEGS